MKCKSQPFFLFKVFITKHCDKASATGASALVIFQDEEDVTFLENNGDLLMDFQMPVYMLNRSGEPKTLDMVSFVSMAHFSDGIAVGTLQKLSQTFAQTFATRDKLINLE